MLSWSFGHDVLAFSWVFKRILFVEVEWSALTPVLLILLRGCCFFFFRNQELASFPTPLHFWALSSHLFFKYLHLKLPREECWWVSPTTPVRSSNLWIFQQFHCSLLEIPTDSYGTRSCSVEFGFWETEWEKPLGKFFWCRSPWYWYSSLNLYILKWVIQREIALS